VVKSPLVLILAFLFAGLSCASADARLNFVWLKRGVTARVNVPPSLEEVCWQRYDKASRKWVDVKVLPVSKSGKNSVIAGPGSMTVKLPSGRRVLPIWRLVGRASSSPNSSGTVLKAPSSPIRRSTPTPPDFSGSFLRGSKKFPGNPEQGAARVLGGLALASPALLSDSSVSSTATTQPLESDIWKIEGSTIYCFNELRGLQVIDASDPANPSLITSYRLPARGQDLYVLPGSSNGKTALLVTYDTDGSSEVLSLAIGANSVTLRSAASVKGWPVDSRVFGDKLYVVTQSWSDDSGNWVPTTRIAAFDLTSETLVAQSVFDFPGASPILAAGADWLAIASTPPNNGEKSEVRVFRPSASGLEPFGPSPIPLAGSLGDQFKFQVAGDILSAISISWSGNWDSRRTVLENFRLAPGLETAPVGSLTLAEGESLFATRFDGDRAYIVTFLQTDPLWVLDLSDSTNPTIAGHLEVPGWSTHLTPLGDGLLFSIGYDNGKVTSSLFDVADPASPTLLSRISSGENWSWSEATWDEKALKVLPEHGLALVPFSTWTDNTSHHAVQILSVDREARTLSQRGVIEHDFSPRRAGVLGENIASISQRALVIVDAANLDSPSVLSDTLLAWPVDRVFAVGDFLLEIENGGSWDNSPAALRVASAEDPDALSADLPLGEKSIIGATIRGDSLYLVRQAASYSWFRPIFSSDPAAAESNPLEVVLEIYSLKSLPDVSLTSSVTISTNPTITTSISKVSFAWPSPQTLSLVLQGRDAFWWGGPVICFDSPTPVVLVAAAQPKSVTLSPSGSVATVAAASVVTDALIGCYPYFRSNFQAALWSVDLTDPAAPQSLGLLRIGSEQTISVSSPAAADGILAIGYDVRETPETATPIVHSNLQVFDVAPKSAPLARPPLDVPGPVTGITNLSSSSGLIWTLRNDNGTFRAEVCSYDGTDATMLDGVAVSSTLLAVEKSSLFSGSSTGVSRYTLSPERLLSPAGTWALGSSPDQIASDNGLVIAKSGYQLFASDSFPSSGSQWTSSLWIPDLSLRSGTKSLVFPAGAYGVQTFPID